jgi:hypothetical protein
LTRKQDAGYLVIGKGQIGVRWIRAENAITM